MQLLSKTEYSNNCQYSVYNNNLINSTKCIQSPRDPVYTSTASRSYLTISSCVFLHILRNGNMTNLEKLYYLLQDGLSSIKERVTKNGRVAALSATYIAKLLGCSRSNVYKIQQSLSDKGYFIIQKSKNKRNQYQKNLITPTLPNEIFKQLCNEPDRYNANYNISASDTSENKRAYLDNTKLFIIIGYELLKFIIANHALSCFARVLLLDLYYKWYLCNIRQSSCNNFLIFTIAELVQNHNLGSRTILATLKELEEIGLINRSRIIVKAGQREEDRADKSLWYINLNLPEEFSVDFSRSTKANANLVDISPVKESNKTSEQTTINDEPINHLLTNLHHSDHAHAPNSPHRYSKYFILKDRSVNTNKNLPNCNNKSNSVDFNSKNNGEEEANNAQCSLYKGKTLLEFYPVSAADVPILQKLSGREFDLNATNQILQSIARKKTGYTFPNKQAFIYYMSLILKHELRQAVQVNNESFKIKANETESERENKEIEQYLSKIEDDFSDISNQAKLKKKLASTLLPRTAYQLLQSIKHIEFNDYILTITTNRVVELKPLDQQIILNQAIAVYGNDLAVKYQLPTPNSKAKKIENDTNFSVGTLTKQQANSVNELRGEWGQIRQSLIRYYGEAINKSWFSKLEQLSIDETTNIITLKAPTGFIKDYIRNHYLATMDSFAQKLFAGKIYQITLVT